MASRPSIVFLYDLDLSNSNSSGHLKSASIKGDEDAETAGSPNSCARFIRHISLNILNYFSEKHANVQWGYRFYASSNYQLTNKARFSDLTAQTLEEFEEALNVRFEQSGIVKDGTHINQMSGAGVLNRTLQDIVSDYEWKTPSESLTPTRKGKKSGKQPLLDHNQQNLVFIFTNVPSEDSLAAFCQLNPSEDVSVKTVTDSMLPKELVKRFQEFQLSLNFIDHSTHCSSILQQQSNLDVNMWGSQNVKSTFNKIASNLRGAVINSSAIASPFSFSQILQASCTTKENLIDECKSCQVIQPDSKVLLSISSSNLQMEADLQCWNPSCSRSSLRYNSVYTGVINCVAVLESSIGSHFRLLRQKPSYLLSSKSQLIPTDLNSHRIILVGNMNGQHCYITPITLKSASIILPTSNYLHWTKFLISNDSTEINPAVESFVNNFLDGQRIETLEELSTSPEPAQHSWTDLNTIKGNYMDKKVVRFDTHWKMLQHCFRTESSKELKKEPSNNCFDQLAQPLASVEAESASSAVNENVFRKVGSSRIQNLRASTLLQKSQEVRAKNDEKERERCNKEKQAADERKEKLWKEFYAYLHNARSSILYGRDLVQLVPVALVHTREEVLERCLQLKKQAMSSQMEDWQWLCLVQVIVSSLLYVCKDMTISKQTINQHFLHKPGSVNRTASKDLKIHEFKFQILLRLELSWISPGLIGEEEDVLLDTTSLLQMLSIQSSPQAISAFYLDTLVFHYENMLPEFLVNLGEELNQPIPVSLNEQNKLSGRTPSPVPSSKALSVQSIASHQEIGDSQRPSVRDLRSRTLSRQPSLNVLHHKKQITLPNKMEKVTALAVKKEEPTEVGRVRRSLHFGAETPRQKTRTKSPAKKKPAFQCLDDDDAAFQPLLQLTTPSKSDFILAPETPSRLRSGGKSGKKTDGVHVVGESPEVKQEVIRRSPRRLEAALALRRRASFYSSMNSDLNPEKTASRNWARAESQVWSEKARAGVNISVMSSAEDNSQNASQPAHYLFSRILSRNDSLGLLSPRKTASDSDSLLPTMPPSLNTPLKVNSSSATLHPPTTPSHLLSNRSINIPDSGGVVLAPATPLKTPKQVQFNLNFQPATPSSKVLPRSILKSPASFQSPSHHQSRTPRKAEISVPQQQQSTFVHLLDETNFNHSHQLDLVSPAKLKPDDDMVIKTGNPLKEHGSDVIHKLDEKSLQADEEVELKSPSKETQRSTPSPMRRSPRRNSSYQPTNFFNRNPNWSVVDYRRPLIDGSKNGRHNNQLEPDRVASSTASAADPYEFQEEFEKVILPKAAITPDPRTHKRKLFQTSSEKPLPPSGKRRRLIAPSPIAESDSMTTPYKFTTPKEGSLFHLENSPMLLN